MLDRNSPIPIYYQIATDIRKRVLRGEWKPGDQLPSQPELARQYQVSRMTLRQAMDLLEREGIIARQRGSGTFLTEAPAQIVPMADFPVNFTQQVRRLGIKASARILAAEIRQVVDTDLAARLHLDATDQVACYQRIFLADEQPVALSSSLIPYRLCPGIVDVQLTNGSLSDTLAEVYSLFPAHVDQWLWATHASDEEAQLLRVPPGSPLLIVNTLSYLPDGTPIEHVTTKCVGDRLHLHAHVGAMDILPEATASA